MEAYDPDAQEEEQDENVEFKGKDVATMSELFFKFAGVTDNVNFSCGMFFSVVMGMVLPGFCFIFGELIDEMGAMVSTVGKNDNPMKDNTIYMVYVALGMLVGSFFNIAFLMIYSESITYKLKIQYFTKALAKDAAFYDEQNPNEMASKINKEASAV